jgi:hypothetical protein
MREQSVTETRSNLLIPGCVTACLVAVAAGVSYRTLVHYPEVWGHLLLVPAFAVPIGLLIIRPARAVRWFTLAVCCILFAYPWLQLAGGNASDSIPCGHVFLSALWIAAACQHWRPVLARHRPPDP